MKQIVHRVASISAFLCIATFFFSTLVVEIFGSHEALVMLKSLILVPGIPILVLSLAMTGATGFVLGKRRKGAWVAAKKKRMPFIAVNGLLVLLPCAVFLDQLAAAGRFDMTFYSVQAIELIAGGINLSLMSLNIRDGLKLSGRLRKPARTA